MKHNSRTSVVADGLIKLSVADDVQEEESDKNGCIKKVSFEQGIYFLKVVTCLNWIDVMAHTNHGHSIGPIM